MNLGQIIKAKMEQRKKKNIKDNYCVRCNKLTAKKELDYNSSFGGYGFERCCNRCAEWHERQIAARQDQF